MIILVTSITLIANYIDMVVLEIMEQRHIDQLFTNQPLGWKIKFEKNLGDLKNGSISTIEDLSVQSVVSPVLPESIFSQSTSNVNTPAPVSYGPVCIVCQILKFRGRKYFVSFQLVLSNILNSTTQGRQIQNLYKKTNELQEGSRNLLVDLIINYILSNEIDLPPKLMQDITTQITDMFPSEKAYEVHQIKFKIFC